LTTVDTHTAGEPTRIVTAGFPPLRGSTIREKRKDFFLRFDNLREALLREPRGHSDMFGAFLTPPEHSEADFGLFFFDGGGALEMCGHATIGVTTAVLETGLMPFPSPETPVVFETTAGLVQTRVESEGEKILGVRLRNVPSFVAAQSIQVELQGYHRKIVADIAYGGNFFAFVDARSLDLSVSLPNVGELISKGIAIREAINRTVSITHPQEKDISGVGVVSFFEPGDRPEVHLRNVNVFGAGQFDRSPGGTATSALLALQRVQGKLNPGEILCVEGIAGGMFEGQIIGETQVQEYPAILPEIKGRAFITGLHTFVLDPDDPFAYGFPGP